MNVWWNLCLDASWQPNDIWMWFWHTLMSTEPKCHFLNPNSQAENFTTLLWRAVKLDPWQKCVWSFLYQSSRMMRVNRLLSGESEYVRYYVLESIRHGNLSISLLFQFWTRRGRRSSPRCGSSTCAAARASSSSSRSQTGTHFCAQPIWVIIFVWNYFIVPFKMAFETANCVKLNTHMGRMLQELAGRGRQVLQAGIEPKLWLLPPSF